MLSNEHPEGGPLTPITRPKAYSYIRISTEVQLAGDSRRRQLQKSQEYAEKHNLELDTEFKLEDLAVSAFRGQNSRKGDLAIFLEAVRQQKIQPGSVLIVESLDRLSRQKLWEAQQLFHEIIGAGINIVTLIDNHVYKANSNDLKDFIFSLVSQQRANEESETKRVRVSEAWAEKRKNAASKKLTVWCPAWLWYNRATGAYEPIVDRVNVVNQIFEDCAAGIGIFSIARRLAEAGTPCFRRLDKSGKIQSGKIKQSNEWHTSYVAKILNSRATFGEFQPHKFDASGKRVPDGPAISNYYPAAITEDLFFRAKNSRTTRNVTTATGGKGRKGKHLSNLFAGLAKCAYCDSPMRYENKGSGPKGGLYLVCDNVRRQTSCGNLRWRYEHFEISFLQFVRELNLQELALTKTAATRKDSLEDKIHELGGRIASLKEDMEAAYEDRKRTAEPVAKLFYAEKIDGYAKQLHARQEELEHVRAEHARIFSDAEAFYDSREKIGGLLKEVSSAENHSSDLYKARSQIAYRLKSLVSEILVAGLGGAPFIRAQIQKLEAENKRTAARLKDGLGPASYQRYFTVRFRNGARRTVMPRADDPHQYDTQLVTSKDDESEIYDAEGRRSFVSDPELNAIFELVPPDATKSA